MGTFRHVFYNLPEYSLGISAILLVSLVFLEVVFRYFLQFPVGWSEEAAMILFIWMSFLGAAVATKRKAHFSFLMAKERFSPKNQYYLSLILQVLIIGASIVLIVQGVRMLKMASYERYISLGITMVWSYLSIPVCSTLILIYATAQLFEQIKNLMEKKRP